MKFKKIFLLFIIFLAMLGMGSMLSNIQSDEANQLLEAYGLSNNTRYIKIKNDQNISTFVRYLEQKFPKNKIQLHLASNRKDKQTLIWSNKDVLTLPTEAGRYFTSDDFKGRVSFGVLGLNANVKQYKTQGNQYIVLNNKYYTVIGSLKHYRQMKQNGYYLTTGSKQPTGQFKLRNYVIIIDSSTRVIRQIAAHYGVKVKTPSFVKSHQSHQFSVIKEILLIGVFILIAGISNLILVFLDWQTVKQTHLSGGLLRNWLLNHGIRTILTEILLVFGAYFFLCWRAFFSKPEHLLLLLLASWIIISIIYSYGIFYRVRKEKLDA